MSSANVPKKEWTWYLPERSENFGVHTYEGKLVWYSTGNPSFAYDAATEQSFEDFLKNGAADKNAPEEIVLEVKKILLE